MGVDQRGRRQRSASRPAQDSSPESGFAIRWNQSHRSCRRTPHPAPRCHYRVAAGSGTRRRVLARVPARNTRAGREDSLQQVGEFSSWREAMYGLVESPRILSFRLSVPRLRGDAGRRDDDGRKVPPLHHASPAQTTSSYDRMLFEAAVGGGFRIVLLHSYYATGNRSAASSGATAIPRRVTYAYRNRMDRLARGTGPRGPEPGRGAAFGFAPRRRGHRGLHDGGPRRGFVFTCTWRSSRGGRGVRGRLRPYRPMTLLLRRCSIMAGSHRGALHPHRAGRHTALHGGRVNRLRQSL